MADLGADVIKIESPAEDDTRIWRPLFIERGEDKAAAYFHGANKGKTSVAIDLKDPEDLAWPKSMIAGADILIENVKIRGPDKVWPRLRQIARRAARPRLLLSYRLWPRRALCLPLGLWFSCARHVRHHEPDRRAKEATAKMGIAFADIFSGLCGVIGGQAALAERARSALGQYVDISLLYSMTVVLAERAMNFFVSGKAPTRLGNGHPNIVPCKVFAVADGHIIIAFGNDR